MAGSPYVYGAAAGYQIISGLHQAEMVEMQAAIQAEIQEFNADLAEYDAWRAEGYGQTQIARYQSTLDQAEGTARASAAAAGVDLTEGSVSEVVAENQMVGLLNKMEIDNQAHEVALGYKRQAQSYRMGAEATRTQGTMQAAATRGGAVASALGTAASGYYASKTPVSELGKISETGGSTQAPVNTKNFVRMMP